MERVLQYMDDLDDLCGMVGLVRERLRNALLLLLTALLMVAIVAAAVLLAMVHPPIALATSILLFVTLLYRAVTLASYERPHSA